jgi:hypothetical protein
MYLKLSAPVRDFYLYIDLWYGKTKMALPKVYYFSGFAHKTPFLGYFLGRRRFCP